MAVIPEQLEWLEINAVSKHTHIPVNTLYNMNYRGSGPPVYRAGRWLLYKRHEVDAWIESQVVRRGGSHAA